MLQRSVNKAPSFESFRCVAHSVGRESSVAGVSKLVDKTSVNGVSGRPFEFMVTVKISTSSRRGVRQNVAITEVFFHSV
ncbi:hypothetical protein CEXT_78511 [Caerostris extrusa]|uniref:Uncharacterized protein n=1 Tax=Caerostris extrusa TaxID=172846 RepID=A0AAV4YA72_CAEEX|nr:hypothetical protein CEXT_78511 [Caerostris extrusa]